MTSLAPAFAAETEAAGAAAPASAGATITADAATGESVAVARSVQPRRPEHFSAFYNYSVRSLDREAMSSWIQSHSVGARYVLNEDWSARFTGTYVNNATTLSGPDSSRTIPVSGLGDMQAQATYTFWHADNHWIDFSLGMSLPTGSINKKDADGKRLPTSMQTGSGTVGLAPGASYVYTTGNWSLGSRMGALIRMGRNSLGYRLGNEVSASTSLSYVFTNYFIPLFTLNLRSRGANVGVGKERTSLTPAPSLGNNSLQDPLSSRGLRLEGLIGARSSFPFGHAPRWKFTVEGGMPVFQVASVSSTHAHTTSWFMLSGLNASF